MHGGGSAMAWVCMGKGAKAHGLVASFFFLPEITLWVSVSSHISGIVLLCYGYCRLMKDWCVQFNICRLVPGAGPAQCPAGTQQIVLSAMYNHFINKLMFHGCFFGWKRNIQPESPLSLPLRTGCAMCQWSRRHCYLTPGTHVNRWLNYNYKIYSFSCLTGQGQSFINVLYQTALSKFSPPVKSFSK